MKIIYIDFVSGDVYDAKGAPFANQNQLVSYLENTEDFEIHYVTDGGVSEDPSEWTPYSGFENIAVSSIFAIDNNFITSYKGETVSAIESGGTITSVTVNLEENAEEKTIPKNGVIVLRNASGQEQGLAYVSRTYSGSNYVFQLGQNETADYAFEEGSTVSVPEALMILAEGAYDEDDNNVNYVDDSRKNEGIFSIHFFAMSDKLMDQFEFTNTESLTLTAEHAIISEGETVKRFQFRIYIKKPIAFRRSADIPQSNAMGIASQSWVLSLLRNKFEFQFSIDGSTEWHSVQNQESDKYYRQRISVVGADWSDAIFIPAGPPGQAGDDAPELKIQYSVDGQNSWHEEYASGDAYLRTSTNNGVSWSGAVRFLGDTGTDGKSAYELWKEEPGNSDKTLDDFFNAYRGADGTGLNVRGAYDPASTYQKTESATDAVQYNGSLWGYINETAGSGNAPPETSETTSNDYWTLLVGKGDKGKNGRGIVSIEKTSTQDNVDTYTITYTDETTSTFTVTNPEEVTWETLSGKPSAFPPSSHTQAISTINGLQAELDSRVKSVNGITPDSSGNVNVSGGSGGSTIKPAYVTAEPSGNTVTVQAITPSADGSSSTNDGQPVTVLWNFELPEASTTAEGEEE